MLGEARLPPCHHLHPPAFKCCRQGFHLDVRARSRSPGSLPGWKGVATRTWGGESLALAGDPTCAGRATSAFRSSRSNVLGPTRCFPTRASEGGGGGADLVRSAAGALSHRWKNFVPWSLVKEPLADQVSGWAWLGRGCGAAALWLPAGGAGRVLEETEAAPTVRGSFSSLFGRAERARPPHTEFGME